MKKTNFLGLLFLTVFSVSHFAKAQDAVVRIPLKTFIKPAFDLVDQNGKALTSGDLEALYKSGSDLSNLNPIENKFWQNKKFEAVDSKLYSEMPTSEEGVIFDDYLGSNRELGIYSIFVRPANDQKKRYGLTFGLQIHSSLAKAALLRKLGVFQESPKHYKSIKIKFSNADKMNEFIGRAFCVNGPSEESVDCLSLDPDKRGFITDKNDKDFTLVLHGSYLEKMNADIPGMFDGLTPASVNTLSYYAQSRAFRALVVPFVVGDIGESINRYSPQSVAIRGGWAYMNFLNNQYFDNLTDESDVKWMLRRMANLTDQDWNEIIAAGEFPASLNELVKTKMLHRFNNMLESFFSKAEKQSLLKIQMPALNVSSNDGVVVNGKVMTQEIAGYPQRFSHGERQSPFESADLIRYMKIKAQSAAFEVAYGKLNEKLTKSQVLTQQINGFEVSRAGIRPLVTVSGISGNLNFNANRIITTGTYYGSQAAVQMVDSITLAASIGYGHILDGLNGIKRNIGANLAYVRSFTHVRPIDSMKQASQVPYAEVFKDSRINHMASPLKDGKITDFLNNLKVGEVFTITDSIGIAGQVSWTTGLDSLFTLATITQPTVSFSADANKVFLRQIQFSKTADGLQVFVRGYNDPNDPTGKNNKYTTLAYGFGVDVNYFINLLKVRAQTTKTDLHTDVFLLNYNSALMAKVEKGEITPDDDLQKTIDKQKAFGDKAALTLRALIFQSSVGPLYSNFKRQQFEIDHGLKTKEIQTKILWYRKNFLNEEHLLTITKPDMPTSVDGGTVNNQAIQVLTTRKGEMTGKDYFGFGLNVVDAFLKDRLQTNAPQLSQDSQNPSQMPFGQAEWRIVRTDTELTQNRVGALPSVSVIEHVWGGWSLKKVQMDKILNIVKEKMQGTQFADYPLLPDGALAQVKKIDFFRVTSHLSLLPNALDKIKDLMTAPEAANQPVEKEKFVARLFQKLSEFGGKARAQDKVVYQNLLKLAGNGDEQVGLSQCKASREAQQKNMESSLPQNTASWINGTNYECVEPWIERLLKLSRKFPTNDLSAQNRWMTDVLYVLDEQIPQSYFLNYLGQDKFIYFVEVTGFRSGDEDGDDGDYVSNVLGEPANKHEYANGLISVFANKSKIQTIELDRSQGSFQ